jgi:predicted DNA-binding transcriptional regulator AlpA
MSYPIGRFGGERLLRLREIIAPHGPLPIGRSTWWAGVKTGIFPQPVKIGQRITAWRTEDIRDLVERRSGVGSRSEQASEAIKRVDGGVTAIVASTNNSRRDRAHRTSAQQATNPRRDAP